MGHIRLISWLLVGTLSNDCMCGSLCQSIPQEVSCYIADHVQIVLKGFPDYAKTSVAHMSSLFYVFMLCQVISLGLRENLRKCRLMRPVITNRERSFQFSRMMRVTFPTVFVLSTPFHRAPILNIIIITFATNLADDYSFGQST